MTSTFFKGLVDAKLYGWSSSSTFKEHVAEADKKDFDRGQNNPGYPPSTLPFPPELDRRLDPQAVDDKTPFAELLLPKEIFDAMRARAERPSPNMLDFARGQGQSLGTRP